jgi:hypothetical protein
LAPTHHRADRLRRKAFETAISVAVELDLFSAIAEGVDTAESLAHRIGAAERELRILADFLTVRLPPKAGWSLSADAGQRYLPGSQLPAYMGSMVEFLAAPEMLELAFRDGEPRAARPGQGQLAPHRLPANPMTSTRRPSTEGYGSAC